MEKQPSIVYVMGVSGSGKTTVGKELALAIGAPFFDADDYHPAANKAKMRAGQALNDEDRKDWLVALNRLAVEQSRQNGAVIACSALKEKYRKVLVQGLDVPVHWVLLHGNFDLIEARIKARKDHYMPASLLQSQFETLEIPADAIVVDIKDHPGKIVADILSLVGPRGN